MKSNKSNSTLTILKFNNEIEVIFTKKYQEIGLGIYRFTKSQLNKFNLSNAYKSEEIISIAYIRTIKSIENGQLIQSSSLVPWLKKVIFNIIKELSRERQKEYVKRKFDKQLENFPDSRQSNKDISLENKFYLKKYKLLMECLKNLSCLEQLILDLRAIKAYSWKEIAEILVEQGYPSISEGTLRKRYQRLRKRLKAQIEFEVDQ